MATKRTAFGDTPQATIKLPVSPVHWLESDEGLTPLGHHSDQTLMNCPAKFDYLINRRLQAPPTKDLLIGCAVHAALSVYHGLSHAVNTQPVEGLSRRAAQAMGEALAYLDTRNQEHLSAEDREFVPWMTKKLLTGYFQTYGELDPWTVIETEQVFDLELFPGLRSTGRIDGIVVQKGLTLLLEHKTTSFSIERFYEQYSISSQITRYCHAASLLLNKPVRGCLLNVLQKTKAKTGGHYARFLITRTDQDIKEFESKLRGIRAVKETFRQQGYWPKNEDTCFDYFRRCEFFHLCHEGGETQLNLADFDTN